MPGDTPDAPDGVPLPPRLPHPLATHVAVDTAVAFLGTVIVGLIIGVSFLVIVAVAILAGLCLAPFTRRTEVRQLAERDAGTPGTPGAPEPPADEGP